MAKKITTKQKNQLKLRILIFVIVCIVSAGSFLYIKLTTPPTLESVLEDVSFDTSEVTLDVTLSNKNETINYTYIVSEENTYIKTIKTIENTIETSILYLDNDIYYLYVDKGTPTTIQLETNDGIFMFNNLKLEVQELENYLDINYSNVKYYYYSEELVTFSSFKDNVFYDYEIQIKNNKLFNLTQTFTVNNIINTVEINVDYNVDIKLPS